jgi:hypothetical protein
MSYVCDEAIKTSSLYIRSPQDIGVLFTRGFGAEIMIRIVFVDC